MGCGGLATPWLITCTVALYGYSVVRTVIPVNSAMGPPYIRDASATPSRHAAAARSMIA